MKGKKKLLKNALRRVKTVRLDISGLRDGEWDPADGESCNATLDNLNYVITMLNFLRREMK